VSEVFFREHLWDIPREKISETNLGLLVHSARKIALPLSTRDVEAIIGVCKRNTTGDAIASDVEANHPTFTGTNKMRGSFIRTNFPFKILIGTRPFRWLLVKQFRA